MKRRNGTHAHYNAGGKRHATGPHNAHNIREPRHQHILLP